MSIEVRRRAVDAEGSFLVQAPAGSGKTELLTQRILKLLAVVDEPEEILALTFTRKAAAEMRERVVAALQMERPDDPDSHRMETWQLAQAANARSDEHGWHLKDYPSRLRMMTLDSFTHALARELPLLSGFGEMPTPSLHVMPLYREAAEMALNTLIRSEPERAEKVLLHQDHNMVALIALVADMLGKRDQWLPQLVGHMNDMKALRNEQEQLLAAIISEQLHHCRELVPIDIRGEMPALLRFAGEQLDDAVLQSIQMWPGTDTDDVATWQTLADLLLLKDKAAFRKSVTKANGFPAGKAFAESKQTFMEMLVNLASVPDLAEALHGLRKLPDAPCFDEAQWQVLEGLFTLLLLAAAQLQRLFEQRSEADFIEIALRAMRAIEDEQGNPTDLLMRLDYRIHHILVDEFQDTSQLQMRLLQNLTEGWQAGDGTHRTLFMVGDPMQSIYRFRKAEVSLFLQVAEGVGRLPATEPLQLLRNFRSAPAIVDWVNCAFATIFPDEPDIMMAAVAHAPAEAARKHDGEVNLMLQQGRDDAAEAAAIVAIIERELAVPDRRIAVLARSRKHLHATLHALIDAGIAYRAVDILPLYEQPEIRLLRALLRALLHPCDRESWAALLRSPCCGVDSHALHSLLAGDARPLLSIIHDPESLQCLDSEALQRVVFVAKAVAPLVSEAGKLPVRMLVEQGWQRLGMAEFVTDAALNNVGAMFDLIEEVDDGGFVDFRLLDERLQQLYAAPDSSVAASRVELMTMHGAKGLQWDTVILPGLGKASGRSDLPLLAFSDVPVNGGMQPLVAARGAVRSSDAIYNLVRGVEKQREDNEVARLLYVACTRAERALYMFGHVPEKGETASSGSLLKLLLPDGIDGGCFGADVQMLESEKLSGEVVPEQQLYRVATLPELPPMALPEDGAESEYFWAGAEAAPVGNAVHAMLQQVAEAGAESWLDNRDSQEVEYSIERMLLGEGLSGDALARATVRSVDAVNRVLASDQGGWILSARHRDAHCEWELSSIIDGRLAHHVIDRSFIDAEGIRWIIDYKTASHEGGGLDAFLDEEVVRHTPQLQRYADIVARLEPERTIRCALYFPMLDVWREVDTKA